VFVGNAVRVAQLLGIEAEVLLQLWLYLVMFLAKPTAKDGFCEDPGHLETLVNNGDRGAHDCTKDSAEDAKYREGDHHDHLHELLVEKLSSRGINVTDLIFDHFLFRESSEQHNERRVEQNEGHQK